MKKGKHLAGAAFLAVILFCLPVGKTSAYMTDSASLLNQMTPGNNTSRIVEDFPPVSPQNPEDDPVFQKTVQITAPAASGQNVDCYVRARILYSNSDIGNTVTLSGTDPAGFQGSIDYSASDIPDTDVRYRWIKDAVFDSLDYLSCGSDAISDSHRIFSGASGSSQQDGRNDGSGTSIAAE